MQGLFSSRLYDLKRNVGHTSTGLKLTHAVLDKIDALKRQTSADFRESPPIQFDDYLPDWNYTVIPTNY